MEYNWPPATVNALTLYQAAIYLGAITPDHGTLQLNWEQFVAMRSDLKRLKRLR
jgi:hypothetical protein